MSDDADSPSDSSSEPQEKRRISTWNIITYSVADWILRKFPNFARYAAFCDTPEYQREKTGYAQAAEQAETIQAHLGELIGDKVSAGEKAEIIQSHLGEIITSRDETISEKVGALSEANELAETRRVNLEAATAKANGLEKTLTGSRREIETLKAHPMMRLGGHITHESTAGVIEFDANNLVTSVNANACNHLGVESAHVLYQDVMDAGREDILGRYIAVFAANATQLLREGKSFEPNTFEIGGIPFDVMGYVSNAGTKKFPVYGGGFFVISPFKTQNKVRKALARLWSGSTLHVRDVVSIDNVVDDYAKPLLGMEVEKPVLDFKKLRSITPSAVSILSKCYGALKTKGVTCLFKNVPYDIAQVLHEQGVAEDHIKNKKRFARTYLSPEKSFG